MAKSSTKLLLAAVAGVALFTAAGCGQTERRMTITSDPSGALVYVNGLEVGQTPVTFDYTWYGDYRVELRKDGYETLKTHQHVRARPNQWVGVDLLTEAFWPGTLTDNKQYHFEMERMVAVNEETLIDRAREFRDQAIRNPTGEEVETPDE